MTDTAGVRAQAARVAKWLVDKGHPDDAVVLLAAWAAAGPNDSEGQQLLAEALRIDPSAPVAQMAFERMEGVPGNHAALDAAIARFEPGEVARLDAEMRRPTFRRAQMGFNNNITYHEQVFHVQTEDSGLDAPHIITHLFADGGRVIKSHKRNYDAEVGRPDVAEFVRSLMKAQHLEMCMWLREGRFDPIIAGREVGGIALFTEPPNVDIKKLAKKKAEAAAADQPPPQPSPAVALTPSQAPLAPVRFRLLVLRSLWGGPECYEPHGDQGIIGTTGEISLDGEVFCHPSEAIVSWRSGRLYLEDLEGGNGVFLRIRTPVELELGDQFVVGDQLLMVEKNPTADDGPDPAPTYFYSSPKWPSSFRIVQVFEGGAPGACVVARGDTLQVGSAVGDLVFPDDPLVSAQHCVVEEQAGSVVLTDLASRTGVFVRIHGEQELVHGDELMVGRTRLVVHLPAVAA
ncbi:MAG: FHA domain-containing protein [Polyangiaceae bacterium]|nr:FHA domain-containing protein [Polyangiaceae bacterium]